MSTANVESIFYPSQELHVSYAPTQRIYNNARELEIAFRAFSCASIGYMREWGLFEQSIKGVVECLHRFGEELGANRHVGQVWANPVEVEGFTGWHAKLRQLEQESASASDMAKLLLQLRPRSVELVKRIDEMLEKLPLLQLPIAATARLAADRLDDFISCSALQTDAKRLTKECHELGSAAKLLDVPELSERAGRAAQALAAPTEPQATGIVHTLAALLPKVSGGA